MSKTAYNAASECKNNTIGKKIAQARKKMGWTQPEFSERLCQYGVTIQPSGLGKWERGERIPDAYQFFAVCRTLNIEDVLYYFIGENTRNLNELGMRKLAEYCDDLMASGKYALKPAVIQYIDMPVSTLGVSAGIGEFLDEGNFEMVSFPVGSVPKGAEFGVRVAGDSMEPVYNDGQIVWVQECSSLSVGEVGVFAYDGCGYLKVYGEKTPEDSDAFTDSFGTVHMQSVLISCNSKYAPRVVQPDLPFEVVGRVL